MRYKYNGARILGDAQRTVRERMEAFDRLPAHVRQQLREAADDANLGAAAKLAGNHRAQFAGNHAQAVGV